MVSKSDIIDPAVAEAAFALKSGETSAPVKGQFGTVLLQVGKVETGSQKSYEDVAAQIKREIAETRAKTEVGTLRDKIEDDRAAGSTLAETAKKLGLKSVTIDAVDRAGRGPDGAPIAALPKTPDVVTAAFTTDIGVDNEALQIPGGGLHLVRRHRHHAVARAHARRGQGSGRGALARRRDRQASAGQGRRHGRQAQGRHHALPTLAKRDRLHGRLGCRHSAQQADAAIRRPSWSRPCSRRRKDVAASAEGENATQRFVYRVIDIVDPPVDAASPEIKQLSASCRIPMPTTSSANISDGSKTILASPSTRRP